jgi:hypothetical protein
VTITVAPPDNGRIRVSILAVPTADLDASGGVFVDLRLGKRDPSDMPIVFEGTAPHVSTIAAGDAAVNELARLEIVAAVTAFGPEDPSPTGTPGVDESPVETAVAPAMKRSSEGKYPIYSHQVGPALKLIIGQSESLRAELAAPVAPAEGEHWYARARFAAAVGHDLRSTWVPI